MEGMPAVLPSDEKGPLKRAPLSARRKIGAYYTPKTVTDVLAEWAVRTSQDLILEPGFGGCGFLESCASRLSAIGSPDGGARLHGCDVDPHAFRFLHKLFGATEAYGNFVLGDFLALNGDAFASKRFDVVIGNPPYVRHHHIVGQQKLRALAIRNELLPALNRQASLWAYFVLHAERFLKTDARAAWILPSSFLHAYYARTLSEHLQAKFAEVRVFALQERIFESEGAAEGSPRRCIRRRSRRSYSTSTPTL